MPSIKLYYPKDRIKALLLLAVAAVVYLPFLNNPLVFDDVSFFKSAISSYADQAFELNFRWFPYSSLGVTWVFFAENPLVYRVQNLLLHGMNVLLLLLLLRLWIALFIKDESREYMAKWGAWLGALAFACHPLATYSVGYLVQRSILMAMLFTLLMHIAYLKGLLENNKRYIAMAVAAYFLAVFSKEHSLLAPAILLPLTWVIRAQIKLSKRVLVLAWIGFAVVGLIVISRATGVLGQVYEIDAAKLLGEQDLPEGAASLHFLSILTQAGLFFKYCLLTILPNPAWMSIDMREPFIHAWADWTSWIGLLAFVCYGLLALFCLLRGGRIALFGLALLYPWSQFPVEFSSVRVQEIFVLYRAYLWLPGYMLILPLLITGWTEKKILMAAVLAVALLVPMSWNRLWVMSNSYRLWDDAVHLLHGEDRLGAHRIYYNRAGASAALGNWKDAIADYRKSLSINTKYPEVRIALAGAYAADGQYQQAIAEYDGVIAGHPEKAYAYYGKAVVLKKLHDDAGVQRQLELSCQYGFNLACMISNIVSKKDK